MEGDKLMRPGNELAWAAPHQSNATVN